MITNLKIEGFRSFKGLNLDLGSLTVLIGPNNSGKTNFMVFFQLLAEAADEKLADGIARRGGLRNLLYADKDVKEILWNFMIDLPEEDVTRYSVKVREMDSSSTVLFEYLSQLDQTFLRREGENDAQIWNREAQHDQTNFGSEVFLGTESELLLGTLRSPTNYPMLDKLRKYIVRFTYYGVFSTSPNAPIRHPCLTRSETRLEPTGDNLTNVLHTLDNTPKYRQAYDELTEIVRLAYPEFDRFYFPAEGGDGRIVLRWQDKYFPDRTFSAAYLSDGILRFLCLIAILLNPDPPPLICIDEPELGLHPSLLSIVAELIQHASEQTQVIVATHSPQLVNYFDVSEIAIVEKEDGETTIGRLEGKEFKHWLEDFMLGDLWLMGELGGRP